MENSELLAELRRLSDKVDTNDKALNEKVDGITRELFFFKGKSIGVTAALVGVGQVVVEYFKVKH